MDLPSGLDADTGGTLGVAVEADVTATFAHHKLGLLTPGGALLAGRVHVVDIGVPANLVAHVGGSAQLLEASDLDAVDSCRARPGAHKNSAGHVVVVAGSPGKIGAPQLVSRGAHARGRGARDDRDVAGRRASAIEANVLEVMTARIDPKNPGDSLDAILAQQAGGRRRPGLRPGRRRAHGGRVRARIVARPHRGRRRRALTMFAGRPSVFMAAKKAILTPHPGELARLLGKTAAEVEADRFRAAREVVAATGAVVVLKGAHTIVASPDSRLAVTPVACPALATAGLGRRARRHHRRHGVPPCRRSRPRALE